MVLSAVRIWLLNGVRAAFIFAAFLAQSRPTSQRQSSHRALRAPKQVLEFQLASFSRLVFVLFQPTPATTRLERSGMGRMDPSLVSFCADQKEVRIAQSFSVIGS